MSGKRSSTTRVLLRRFGSSPRSLIVLDFDGTLVPIRRRSALALLRSVQRIHLSRLNHGRLFLAVLSGRALLDVQGRVGVPGIFYGGVFGLEMTGTGFHFMHRRARSARRALNVLADDLRRTYIDMPGVWVEDKGVGLSLHHRMVTRANRPEFDRRLADVRRRAPGRIEWRLGKRAWEITPVAKWDKGSAVGMLWRKLDRPDLLVVGDDATDEPMIRFAQEHGGIGVHVGVGSSAAKLRFLNPTSVGRFLRALADRSSGHDAKFY